MTKFEHVDDYILSFPSAIQDRLLTLRKTILTLVPEAEESISYGMPAYKTFGIPLVYFAGYANHIGFYATPNGHEEFAKEFSMYKQGKGSVQFPHDKPLPIKLIERVVKFRVKANEEKTKAKKTK
jgi:uncharacterized protein YdhG (YjbR/CyaY superfamily)